MADGFSDAANLRRAVLSHAILKIASYVYGTRARGTFDHPLRQFGKPAANPLNEGHSTGFPKPGVCACLCTWLCTCLCPLKPTPAPAAHAICGGSCVRAGRDALGARAGADMTRSPLAANAPTLAELGYKDVDVAAWQGIMGPQGHQAKQPAPLKLAVWLRLLRAMQESPRAARQTRLRTQAVPG